MREAQAEIKATVSVNTGDGLGAKQDDKDPGKDDTKKKGKQFIVDIMVLKTVILFYTLTWYRRLAAFRKG